MWYDENVKVYGDYSKKINQVYVDLNHYDLIFSKKRNVPNMAPAWERLPLLLDTLNTNKYDYVMWIDADACFNLESNFKLDKLIDENKDKHIIFSSDIPNPKRKRRINTGVMIFKNTPFSKIFILTVLSSDDKNCMEKQKRRNWEQDCVNYLYVKNIFNIRENSIILDFNILQTFPLSNKFEKNALVYHYAGADKNKRVNNIKELNLNTMYYIEMRNKKNKMNTLPLEYKIMKPRNLSNKLYGLWFLK